MKKYIKPIIQIVKIENESILAGSDLHEELGGSQLSKKRTGDVWDFEDEIEE